jgi:hypothetical protein
MYRRIDNRPFSLANFKPLWQIYADEHPNKVIGKPAQRGASEYAICYTGFALDRGAAVWTGGAKAGLNVAYIFPKKEALGDFSKERLSGLISESDYLARMFGDDDYNAITFKQVGDSFLYLRGGWSSAALKSFPADVLILDEFDEMASSAIALARRRLNASLVRRELALSTPSIPMKGIHALYLESDRHVYEQLHRCGSWVRYDFLRDVRAAGEPYDVWQQWPAEQIRRVVVSLECPSCGGVVSDEERISEGRWVAEAPDVKGLRGYWIPPLPFPFVDLTRLAASAVNPDPSEREQFFQQDLGLPYTVAGSKVTASMLQQLAADRMPAGPWRDTTMGADVGSRWHWRVSSRGPDGRIYVRAVGAAHSWDDLDALMRHFRVRSCVVDALPELDGSKQFAARWPGRVLRAFYPGPGALKGQLWALDGAAGRKRKDRRAGGSDSIQINRTMAMDRVYGTIARADEVWAPEVVADPECQAHMTSPTRTEMTDSTGQRVATWVHALPDHLYHAAVYDTIARQVLPPEARGFQGAVGGVRPELLPPPGVSNPLARQLASEIPGAKPGASRHPGQSRKAHLRQILAGYRIAQIQQGAPPVPGRRLGRKPPKGGVW